MFPNGTKQIYNFNFHHFCGAPMRLIFYEFFLIFWICAFGTRGRHVEFQICTISTIDKLMLGPFAGFMHQRTSVPFFHIIEWREHIGTILHVLCMLLYWWRFRAFNIFINVVPVTFQSDWNVIKEQKSVFCFYVFFCLFACSRFAGPTKWMNERSNRMRV